MQTTLTEFREVKAPPNRILFRARNLNRSQWSPSALTASVDLAQSRFDVRYVKFTFRELSPCIENHTKWTLLQDSLLGNGIETGEHKGA